ncbi:MAG TPA: hypothetical protein VJ327_03000 [Patescibacteria group bacterium]|nr:hypothetical protein [Patescibacteria group bacterium]
MAGLSAVLYYYTVLADFKRVLKNEQPALDEKKWRKPVRDPRDETIEVREEDPCGFPAKAILGLDPEMPERTLNIKQFIDGPLAELSEEVLVLLANSERLRTEWTALSKDPVWILAKDLILKELE